MLFTENLNLNLPEDGDQYDVELFNQNARAIDGKLSDVSDALDATNAKIPAQANAKNQLADKDFVNSSIATNTAYFIDVFDSVEELNAYGAPLTNNDYAYVKNVDSAGNVLYDRYKYDEREGKWKFEYSLNNTGFTSEQFAAINSGATAEKIRQIKTMTGATAKEDGEGGLVPPPGAGQENSYLCANGKWQVPVDTLVRQAAFDAAHPIGDTYTQYPMMDAPATLYNKDGVQSTWEVVDYYGAFFRATGGLAEPFIEKTVRQTVYWRADADPVVYYGDKELTKKAEVPEGAEAVPVGAPDENNVQEGYVEKSGVLSKQAQATSVNGMRVLPHSHRILLNTSGRISISNVYPGSVIASNVIANNAQYYEKYFYGTNDNFVIEETTIALDSDDPETRPANYTYRIWRRTA